MTEEWVQSALWPLVWTAGLVGLVAVVVTVRWATGRRRKGARRAEDLGPYDLAVVHGGEPLAVAAAIGALRAMRAVEPGEPAQRLTTTGEPPTEVGPLDRTVHRALTRRAYRPGALERVPEVKAELRALRERAVAERLIRRQTTCGSLGNLVETLLVAGVLIGGMGGLHEWADGRPALPYAALVAVSVLLFPFLRRVPRRTRQGDAVVRELRRRYAHLDPSVRPGWSSDGPATAAISVALFGADAIGGGRTETRYVTSGLAAH